MKRVFKNKISFFAFVDNAEYYQFFRGIRLFNGQKRRGTYYYCSKSNKEFLKQFDNIEFLIAKSEFAPEQKKQVLFIFD